MTPVLHFINCMVILTPVLVISSFAQDLQYPSGVAVDGRGNILVLDKEAHAVMQLDNKGGGAADNFFSGGGVAPKAALQPFGNRSLLEGGDCHRRLRHLVCISDCRG